MLGEAFRGVSMPPMPSLSLLRFRMQERGNAVLRLRHCDAEPQIERTSFLSALKPLCGGLRGGGEWIDKLAIRTYRRVIETVHRQAEKMGVQRLHARERRLRAEGRRIAHRAGDHERSRAIKVTIFSSIPLKICHCCAGSQSAAIRNEYDRISCHVEKW